VNGAYAIPDTIADALEAGIPAFKAFRIYAGRSIPELALAARMEPRRLADIEAGRRPRLDEVTALGTALAVPLHLLIVA
jgi:hypothetical protein